MSKLVAVRSGSPHPSFKMEKLVEKDRRLASATVPDVVICGAAKSATTSLWNYLVQHPRIYKSSHKEPGYFSALRPMRSPGRYTTLYRDADSDQITVDASTAYITSPDSAERIRNACPKAKIIIVLRNPAHRAFSLYRHMVWHGFEYASTFEDALHLEEERVRSESFLHRNPEYYYNFLYYRSGKYIEQIERYLNHFPEEQILFLRFRDFVSETGQVMEKVFRFLGIDSSFQPKKEIHNSGQGHDVWSPKFHYFLNQQVRHPVTDWGLPGRALFSGLVRLNSKWGEDELSDDMERHLLLKLKKYIRLAESQTGLELASLWLSE